jgi:hypothetical protein
MEQSIHCVFQSHRTISGQVNTLHMGSLVLVVNCDQKGGNLGKPP